MKRIIMLLGVALVDVLSVSGIEINSELSPKALIETNLSYLVNIQRLQARPLDGDERIRQLTLMTNMMQCAIRTNAFSHVEWYDRLSLIGWSLGLPAVRSDEGALVYCANLISSVDVISTNSYLREGMRAYDLDRELRGGVPVRVGTLSMGKYWGPNLRAFHGKWRQIFSHNRLVSEFRRSGTEELSSAIAAYSQRFGEEKELELKSKIEKLDRFTEDERKLLLGEAYLRRVKMKEKKRVGEE